MNLKTKYKKICNEYVERFCQKQFFDLSECSWVSDVAGGILYCGDFYFDFADIVLDIDSDQPKGQIIDWYYDIVDNYPKSINYFSYTKGLRFKDLP